MIAERTPKVFDPERVDDDSPELDAAFFARARPGAEVDPELAAASRRRRGPQKRPTKTLVSLRLDREVVEAFRAGGPGWQVRMNAALRAAAGLPRD